MAKRRRVSAHKASHVKKGRGKRHHKGGGKKSSIKA
jgi:hypothetical protein